MLPFGQQMEIFNQIFSINFGMNFSISFFFSKLIPATIHLAAYLSV